MTRNKNDWGEINETETKAKYTESIKKKMASSKQVTRLANLYPSNKKKGETQLKLEMKRDCYNRPQ